MTNIQTLYKAPIWVQDNTLSQDELSRLEKVCIEKCESMPDYPDDYNPDIYKFSRTSKLNPHLETEFKQVSNLMLDAAKGLMLGMGYSDKQSERLSIANSWYGIYKNGDNLPMHTHRNSFLSGAYYIKDVSDSKLRFMQDMYRNTPYPADVWNEWGCNVTEFDCVPGRILIFPSETVHGIDQLHSGLPDDEIIKVMLSYNFVFGH